MVTREQQFGHRVRSALAVQSGVVFALAVREMYRKFGAYKLGVVWALIEPIMMILVFMLIFGARGRGEFGFIDPPLFILASFLPFKVLFTQSLQNVNTSGRGIGAFKALRQVSLFDLMLARILLTSVTALLSLVVISLGLAWVGYDPVPDRLIETLAGLALIMLFGFGLGIIFCVLGSFAKEMDKITGLINLPLLFLSAVFFPMTIVPEPFRTYLSYNPLVHPMEMIREMWFSHYTSPVLDLRYYGIWLVCLWALAMACYRLRWRQIVAA
ncbi:ABC transporter permease [Kordiimonas aestuarii]|uniref:ABC transporter permease n=1 Tax=Kordiimonas aestuarii TaxID=1005925 RepID=UPI0021D34651|nr:ABC transporter permease [Kordiimonas aestuarii]